MTPSFFLYNLVGTGAGLTLTPLLWLYFRNKDEENERFRQRMGRYPQSLRVAHEARPRVWLHAVSVGEVGAAAAILKPLWELRPDCHVTLSCTTRQGLARARSQLADRVESFYAPIDLAWPVDQALTMVRPDVLVFLETEIWPNWIERAHRKGIRIAMVNGRISVRSIHNYRKIHPLMRHALSRIDRFSMISSADAARIESMGADRGRIQVHGNAKFDSPDPQAAGDAARQWARRLLNLADTAPVIVAGSTRHPEEKIVMEAYARILQSCPEAILILAPRHLNHIDDIEAYIKTAGFTCQRRTMLDPPRCERSAQVVLLDTIGELAAIYSVASLVFCGGSLVRKGGQNVLEPAMWSKPVLFGPSMEDFADARTLIEKAGGGVTVQHGGELAEVASDWLRHPFKADAAGKAARRAILAHRGAAAKHAAVISRLLGDL